MIKVLHKSLNILEYLSRHPDGASLTNIADAIGEKTTTTSNIVQVLAKRNYLERNGGRWKLGVSAYMLAGRAYNYDEVLCAAAEPILCRLAEETASAAVLSIWRNNERYVILRVADESDITVNLNYPESGKVYITVSGMILLAYQPEDVIRAYIAKHGTPDNEDPTDVEISEFCAKLSEYRKKGFCMGDDEQIFDIAAPVSSKGGIVNTAIGVFLPRFRAGDPEEIQKSLLSAAAELKKKMREFE